MDWRENLISSSAGIRELLAHTHRVAVLGMRPERYPYKPAFYVPAALADLGLEIIPVPFYDRDVRTILGRPVYHSLAAIPGPIDLVDVFRRSEDIAAHLDDMLASKPGAVWFQSGIRNDQAAETLARAGIKVVQDRCLMVEYRRLQLAQSSAT
jgi:predicted CoA-binding protein